MLLLSNGDFVYYKEFKNLFVKSLARIKIQEKTINFSEISSVLFTTFLHYKFYKKRGYD